MKISILNLTTTLRSPLIIWRRQAGLACALLLQVLALSTPMLAAGTAVPAVDVQLENVIINEVGVDGRIELYNGTAAAVDVSNYWLCNFPAYSRIGDATSITVESGNLLMEPGEFLVLSGFGGFNATDAELGLYVTNNFGDAASLISYLEYGSAGHRRAGLAIVNGIWENNQFLTPPTAEASIQTFVDEADVLSWSNATPTFGAANELVNAVSLLDLGVEVSIFPNPGHGRVTVALSGLAAGPTEFTVYDQVSRVVLRQRINAANGQNEIDLGNVPAGTYLLRINQGQAATTQRLTVL